MTLQREGDSQFSQSKISQFINGLYTNHQIVTLNILKETPAMIVVYIFIGLVALLLLMAALMSKTFNIEKTIVIRKPVPEVMKKIFDLNYYSKWNPWQQTDRTAQNQITGTPGTPGHKYSWQGKKV